MYCNHHYCQGKPTSDLFDIHDAVSELHGFDNKSPCGFYIILVLTAQCRQKTCLSRLSQAYAYYRKFRTGRWRTFAANTTKYLQGKSMCKYKKQDPIDLDWIDLVTRKKIRIFAFIFV